MAFKTLLPTLLLGTVAFAPLAVAAQETEQPAAEQPAAEQPAAEQPVEGQPAEPVADEAGQATAQCREQMFAFTQQMREDQLWIGGWEGGWGYGWNAAAPAPIDGAMGADPALGDPALADPAGVAPMGADPWAGIGQPGMPSPRGQISVLYAAAQVFAQQGNQEGCAYVMSELESLYGGYVAQLGEVGVGPEQITDWRQEQIALAEPVTEAEWLRHISADSLIGTDVRTPADENLGSVNDVVVDPETGDISHLVVARGGFLGIGEEYVAVPWDRVRSTPGLGTLVIEIAPEQFEAAPPYDSSVGQQDWFTQFGEDLDAFWRDLTS